MNIHDYIYAYNTAALPIPDSVNYAAEILEAADHYVFTDTSKLEQDMRAAITEGTLPAAKLEKTLDAIAVAASAGSRRAHAAEQARKAARLIVRERVLYDAPKILEALRIRFDMAVTEMISGTLKNRDRNGLGLMAQYVYEETPTSARAVEALEGMRAARKTLAHVGYGPQMETAAWYSAPRSRQEFVDLSTALNAGGFPAMAEHGVGIRLNTAAEAEAAAEVAVRKQPRDLLFG